MRTVLLLLTCLIPLAAAHEEPHAIILDIEMHDSGGEYWFEVAGSEGRNPPIALEPGAAVEVTVTNMGSAGHDLHFDLDGDGQSDLSSDDEAGGDLAPGENSTFSFVVPGDVQPGEYWCAPHRAIGMTGETRLVDHDDEGAPGFAAAATLAALAAVAALRRR